MGQHRKKECEWDEDETKKSCETFLKIVSDIFDREHVTVWNLSYLDMRWYLTLGEMILPILH
jgi:hypothetical protein